MVSDLGLTEGWFAEAALAVWAALPAVVVVDAACALVCAAGKPECFACAGG